MIFSSRAFSSNHVLHAFGIDSATDEARGDLRPALRRVRQSLHVIMRKADATSLRVASEVAK
jgi:hypothetical protein